MGFHELGRTKGPDLETFERQVTTVEGVLVPEFLQTEEGVSQNLFAQPPYNFILKFISEKCSLTSGDVSSDQLNQFDMSACGLFSTSDIEIFRAAFSGKFTDIKDVLKAGFTKEKVMELGSEVKELLSAFPFSKNYLRGLWSKWRGFNEYGDPISSVVNSNLPTYAAYVAHKLRKPDELVAYVGNREYYKLPCYLDQHASVSEIIAAYDYLFLQNQLVNIEMN